MLWRCRCHFFRRSKRATRTSSQGINARQFEKHPRLYSSVSTWTIRERPYDPTGSPQCPVFNDHNRARSGHSMRYPHLFVNNGKVNTIINSFLRSKRQRYLPLKEPSSFVIGTTVVLNLDVTTDSYGPLFSLLAPPTKKRRVNLCQFASLYEWLILYRSSHSGEDSRGILVRRTLREDGHSSLNFLIQLKALPLVSLRWICPFTGTFAIL